MNALISLVTPGFPTEVWDAVVSSVLHAAIFWDVTPYSLIKTYRRFGPTYCLHSLPFYIP